MTADTEATPDLWNSDQVRDLIVNALARSAGDSQADRVMEVIRDVLATVAAAQCESAARTQQTITRLRAKLDEARTRLALHVVDPDHHAHLMQLMEAGAMVQVTGKAATSTRSAPSRASPTTRPSWSTAPTASAASSRRPSSTGRALRERDRLRLRVP